MKLSFCGQCFSKILEFLNFYFWDVKTVRDNFWLSTKFFIMPSYIEGIFMRETLIRNRVWSWVCISSNRNGDWDSVSYPEEMILYPPLKETVKLRSVISHELLIEMLSHLKTENQQLEQRQKLSKQTYLCFGVSLSQNYSYVWILSHICNKC